MQFHHRHVHATDASLLDLDRRILENNLHGIDLNAPIKPYVQEHYQAYHGMADLYVYFYELGLQLLKPGGRMSFIVTNKWMKSSYGEPLCRYFTENARMESVVNFGHAKQIFAPSETP